MQQRFNIVIIAQMVVLCSEHTNSNNSAETNAETSTILRLLFEFEPCRNGSDVSSNAVILKIHLEARP
jgi:hypothetical protein